MANDRPDFQHEPVLCREIVRLLAPEPGRTGVRLADLTVGLGGHSEALLEALPGAQLLGVDRDAQALEHAQRRLARFGDRVHLAHGEFSHVAELLDGQGWPQVDAVLADLGVSSMQLDDPRRGFSFRHAAALDMRMDAGAGETAADLLGRASEAELAHWLARYGEEPEARRIARAIARGERPTTTDALRERVAAAVRRRKEGRDPATLTFQALRIALNRELEELDRLLEVLPGRLATGARVAILAYHSLEDRRVKETFRRWTAACVCPPDLPVCRCGGRARALRLTRGALQPSPAEIARNPRARSARLRAVEWIDGL